MTTLEFSAAGARDLPRLKVSENRRFLVTADGQPFFWLADTGWWIRQLPPPLVQHYLTTRAQQGFNVIQVHPGLAVTNHAGHRPFINDAPSAPNEAFWQDVDALVRGAAGHGLYVAFAPLWGNEYGKAFGTNEAAAFAFGQWIGRRYAGQPNVLWIVSGEYAAINSFRLPIRAEQKAVLNAAAQGLRDGHCGTQLMTIHPGGSQSSSRDFHGAAWLDVNMLQSGHLIDSSAYKAPENHELISRDYALIPTKPVLDGEPIYEDTPDAVWSVKHINGPRAGADAVRRKAYWSVFSGACGHTYGHNDVYGFFTPAFPGQVLSLQTNPSGPGQRGDWRAALQAPGATQMRHLRRLIESRPFLTQVPDRSLLATSEKSPLELLAALRGEGYALVYTPTGKPFRVRLDRLKGLEVQAWWFDPRTGKSQAVGRFACEGEREFTPPGQPRIGNDWVLALDDPARQLPAPGSARLDHRISAHLPSVGHWRPGGPLAVLLTVALLPSGLAAASSNRIQPWPANPRYWQSEVFPERDWAEATPESQGVDAARLEQAVAWLDVQSQPDGARALVVVRHGRLIWKGPEADAYRKVFSCTKVFTSTVLGLLLDDGKCQLDDRATQHWPALAGPYAAYSNITLRHLASMSGGYQGIVRDVSPEQPWGDPLAYLVAQPPRYEAGTACAYHDHDVHLLGSILTRLAQQPLQEVFRRRVADPIGMRRWHWGVVGVLETGVTMNNAAGTPAKNPGIETTTLDLARLGLLYLNRGCWSGRQLLSTAFVDQATTNQVSVSRRHATGADPGGHYGFCWWTNGRQRDGQSPWPAAPPRTYSARGALANVCFVVPEWNMVIARVAAAPDESKTSDQTWNEFFGKLGPAVAFKR